ncbi:hypothetical protein BU14_2148s0001 [Porphyra umbilicalis]|uniref:Uncharacterized protein n=1 Tax=Porphyra umbilicalis TaxID=2786 RepID=A0A1X6NJS4_PORUM|nr:hypothetical protein BU14_2148s0001 [Porphyra umbilicalis]|eukprot:OSX68869.1 hypothetical protein BU14_2148s0001 [Porphyra umbilicalis]
MYNTRQLLRAHRAAPPTQQSVHHRPDPRPPSCGVPQTPLTPPPASAWQRPESLRADPRATAPARRSGLAPPPPASRPARRRRRRHRHRRPPTVPGRGPQPPPRDRAAAPRRPSARPSPRARRSSPRAPRSAARGCRQRSARGIPPAGASAPRARAWGTRRGGASAPRGRASGIRRAGASAPPAAAAWARAAGPTTPSRWRPPPGGRRRAQRCGPSWWSGVGRRGPGETGGARAESGRRGGVWVVWGRGEVWLRADLVSHGGVWVCGWSAGCWSATRQL